MLDPATYTTRRRRLLEDHALEDGVVLLLGNDECVRNYASNPYPFRQDSTFLYFLGLDVPGLAAVIDPHTGSTRLYGEDPDLEDVVWEGKRPSTDELAQRTGASDTAQRDRLAEDLSDTLSSGRRVHFLPPYRTAHTHRLKKLLGISPSRQCVYASESLARAVIHERSRKSEAEVEQLNQAVSITADMHEHAFQLARPGTTEREIAGSLCGIASAQGAGLSFSPTCSVHGEVLHNHDYGNTLQDGDLLLVDAGAESPLHYAGDVTRVAPVGGTFTPRQEPLYQAVLDAQEAALDALSPTRTFREVHHLACRVLTEHLIELGLMQGDPGAAVDAGAHALFFPHGLGHMLGLDTHDMENLGEDLVGYGPEQERSDQFGLDALRLARPLEPGFVVTVEPGCYFIPELIDQWEAENRHDAFINYDTVRTFEDVGGIRIEDDALVTAEGARRLGPSIPKSVEEVEEIVGTEAAL